MATKPQQRLILLAGADFKRKVAIAGALRARNPRGVHVLPRLSEAARQTLIDGRPVASLNSSEASTYWLNVLDYFYNEVRDCGKRATLDGYGIVVSAESPIDILATATADMPAGLFPIEVVVKRMRSWLRSAGLCVVDIPAPPSASLKRTPFLPSEVEYHVLVSRFRRDGALAAGNHVYASYQPDPLVMASQIETAANIVPPPNFSA